MFIPADSEWFRMNKVSLLAISNFLLWLKLFYFLRLTDECGFFITMLGKVMERTRAFFCMFVIMLTAFSTT